MASTPKTWVEHSEDMVESPKGHRLPGWTVDALLEEGKVDEARLELARLIQEGIDSGPGIPAEEVFGRLRAQRSIRAAQR